MEEYCKSYLVAGMFAIHFHDSHLNLDAPEYVLDPGVLQSNKMMCRQSFFHVQNSGKITARL